MNEVERSRQAKSNANSRLEALANKEVSDDVIKDVALFQAEQEILRLKEEIVEQRYIRRYE